MKHKKIIIISVVLAALLILLSFAPPVFNKVTEIISSLAAGWGSGTETLEAPESTNGMYDEYISGDYLNPIEGLEPLPASIIGKYPFDNINIDISSNSYLGCFSGYYVVLRRTDSSNITGNDYLWNDPEVIDIGGYLFWGDRFTKIIAFKDGEITQLLDLFELNVINDNQINTIYHRYNEYKMYFNSASVVLDYSTIKDSDLKLINEAWERTFGEGQYYAESIYDIRHKNISEYCFGKIRDVIVFRTNKTIADSLNAFYIADVKFLYGSPTEFWVYKDGDLFSLIDAYNLGFLTIEDIQGIAMVNNAV